MGTLAAANIAAASPPAAPVGGVCELTGEIAAELTVAQFMVRQMQAWGIDVVFGVPGDTVLPFLDALRATGRPRFIVCRNTDSAALMASAYAKTTGQPAAVVADSGPGAVQMLSGVFDAFMDRVPLIAITGEPPTARAGAHWPQAADIDALFREPTVFNHTLTDGGHVARIFGQALRQAMFRSRPVRIGVPQNVWTQTVNRGKIIERPADLGATVRTDERSVQRAAEMLERAERPVLFAGIGVAKAVEPLLQLAEKLGAPIVHSMPALGLIPPDNPWNLGVVGKFGTQAAAYAAGQADVILAVGTTWWQPEYMSPTARVIQVDRTREHIGLTYSVDMGVWGEAADVLPRLVEAVPRGGRTDWREAVARARQELNDEVVWMSVDTRQPLQPGTVMAAVGQALAPGAIVALDVGNHAFWFARYHRAASYKLLLSGHWRTMGFSLPAGIAAKLAAYDRQVVVICGDGGFAVSMAELTTAVQHQLPIAVIVLRDGRYGQEETLQKMTGNAPFGTGLHNADWAAYAQACGAAGYRVETYEQLLGALYDALPKLAYGQVSVLDVAVDRVDPLFPQPHTGIEPTARNGAERERSWLSDWAPVPFR